MSRSRMTMRAIVERNTAVGTDAHGGPLPPSFSSHATLPCWLWSTSERQVTDGDKTALVQDLRAMFPIGADVIEGDEIASVTDRQGSEILGGRVRIEAIERKHRHVEAALLRVQ